MDERIDELRERLREDPSSRQFYQLGELLRREGEDAEAVEVLRAGLEQHPFYVAAWVSLGRALLDLERHEQADEALREALNLDPENAVAARLRGQVAIERGDWLGAVKALKLARALTPGDRELDERIAEVEAHLAAAPRTVVALSPEDPFDLAPRGDSGIWVSGDADVFALPEPPAPPPPEPVPAAEPGAEPFAGDGGDPFAAAAANQEPAIAAAEPAFKEIPRAEEPFAAEPEPEPKPEVEVEPAAIEAAEPEEAFAPAEPVEGDADELLEAIPETIDLPLPTVTLARLALEQGDLELARRTATGVLEQEPGSLEAQELLAAVDQAEAGAPAAGPDSRYATILALQRWLEAVRLAAGKLAP